MWAGGDGGRESSGEVSVEAEPEAEPEPAENTEDAEDRETAEEVDEYKSDIVNYGKEENRIWRCFNITT